MEESDSATYVIVTEEKAYLRPSVLQNIGVKIHGVKLSLDEGMKEFEKQRAEINAKIGGIPSPDKSQSGLVLMEDCNPCREMWWVFSTPHEVLRFATCFNNYMNLALVRVPTN